MGRTNATRKNKNADMSTASSSSRSSAPSSIGTSPTAANRAKTPTTPLSVISSDIKPRHTAQNGGYPPSNKHNISTEPWWIRCRRWLPQPCIWWPCRTFKNSKQALKIFLRGFTSSQDCWDRCMVVILLAATFFGSWIAIEGLLGIVKLVNAQDANCSIVYVTIPGPIITVSLIGASASDPARGTYYYSVVDGTTQWLNSNIPPSRPPVRSTSMFSSTGELYVSSRSSSSMVNPSASVPSTPGLPAASSILTPTAPVQSTVASTGVLYTSSWSMRSTVNSFTSDLLTPSLSTTLSEQSGIATITSTVSQGLTLTFTRPFTATSLGRSNFPESRFTLSLPRPSLPSSFGSSSIIILSSTSPQGSTNVPPNTTPSSTSVALLSSLSIRPSSSSLSTSSPTSISSIHLTSSSIISSMVISTALPSTSEIPLTSSSSLKTATSNSVSSISSSAQLTVTLTSTGIPPALTSSSRLSSTPMVSTTFVEPTVISFTLPPSIPGSLPSWNNFTSSTLDSSTPTSGSTLSPSFTSNSSPSLSTIPTSPVPLFSITTSRNLNSAFAGAITTQIISFGNTGYSFVFPVPDITTTLSYWTGSYPTVSGSETGMASTTRSTRQTPLSMIPSFQIFNPQPTGFKTIILGSATHTIVAAAAETTGCGEYGNFTLNFDDTSVGQAKSNILPVNGLTNPYHHLFYANGYTYVPDKWEPYPAISQPNVAMFLPFGGLLPNTPFAGTLLPGEIGAGPRASVSAYWFNAFHGYFGCALNGITPCTLRISGYRYDTTMKQEVLVVEQNVTVPACYGYIKCRLTRVFFNDEFKALSGIQFNAYTYNLGIPQVFMLDSLQMEWYNSSCAAGILRIGHR